MLIQKLHEFDKENYRRLCVQVDTDQSKSSIKKRSTKKMIRKLIQKCGKKVNVLD